MCWDFSFFVEWLFRDVQVAKTHQSLILWYEKQEGIGGDRVEQALNLGKLLPQKVPLLGPFKYYQTVENYDIAYSESGGIKYAAKSLHLNICSASGMYQFNLIKR